MPGTNIPQLQQELADGGIAVDGTPVLVGLDADRVFLVTTGGRILQPDKWPEGAAKIIDKHVPEDPPPSKNDILLSLLSTIDPEEPDTTVLWLVLQEALQP